MDSRGRYQIADEKLVEVPGGQYQGRDGKLVLVKSGNEEQIEAAKAEGKVAMVVSHTQYVAQVRHASHLRQELHAFLANVLASAGKEGNAVMVAVRMSNRFSREGVVFLANSSLLDFSNVEMVSYQEESRHEMITKIAAHQLKLDRDAKNRLDAQAAEAGTSSKSTASHRIEELDAKTAVISGRHQDHREANQMLTAIITAKVSAYRTASKKATVITDAVREIEENSLVIYERTKDGTYIAIGFEKKKKTVTKRLENAVKKLEKGMAKEALEKGNVTVELLNSFTMKDSLAEIANEWNVTVPKGIAGKGQLLNDLIEHVESNGSESD